MNLRNVIFALSLLALGSCVPEKRTGKDAGYALPPETVTGADTIPERINIIIEKQIIFDSYTLADTFPYRDTVRIFQWSKVRAGLAKADSIWRTGTRWGVLRNRANINGEAPLVAGFTRNAYKRVQDTYGIERYQGIPFYSASGGDSIPERYGMDGSLVKIYPSAPGDSLTFTVEPVYTGGRWVVPRRYVLPIDIDTLAFDHAIFVDRGAQTITTLERSGSKWLVRSMNPVTTGRHNPPYQKETPLGIFVIQEKKSRMVYLVDGSRTEKGGFAPYASRFCNGGYIHGIPVNAPHTKLIEYSWSLGTTPRSHMCVRNATSHAKFVYDNFPTLQTLIFVIE